MTVITVSLLFGLVGILFVGLSIPLIRNRVPPNPHFGFRTSKTLSDPKMWYEVNHISGNDPFLAGVLITVSSLAMFLFGQSLRTEYATLTLLSVMVLSLVGVLVHSLVVLKRM